MRSPAPLTMMPGAAGLAKVIVGFAAADCPWTSTPVGTARGSEPSL